MVYRFYVLYFILSLFVPALMGQDRPKIDSLQKVLRTAGQDTNRVSALCRLCLVTTNDIDSAYYFGETGLKLAQKISAQKQAARCLMNLGIVAGDAGEFQRAVKYTQQSINVAKALNDKILEANCLRSMGGIYYNNDKNSFAIVYYQKALTLNLAYKDTLGLIRTLTSLAESYEEMGDFAKALDYYQQSLKLSEKLGYTSRAIKANNGIAAIYQINGKYDKSLEIYKKSLTLSKAINEKILIGDAYSNIGEICAVKKNYRQSIEFFENAIKYYTEIDYRSGVAEELTKLGDVYNQLGNYQKAAAAYLKAQKLYEALKETSGLCILFNKMVSFYLKNSNPNLAIQYNQKSLSFALEIQIIPYIIDAYKNSAQIDSALGDYRSAFEHYKLAVRYQDSLFTESQNKHLAELETKYETEKKEQKIFALQKANELQSQKEYAYITSSVVLFMLFGVSYYSYQNKRRSNTILKAKNEEIQQQKEEIIAQSEQITVQLSDLQLKNNAITEQKEEIIAQSEQIRQQLTKLQALDAAKQALGAMLIHDLKNPLSSIIHLSDQEPTPRVRNMIHQAGRQMLNLILNLLDVHRFESAEMKLNLEDVALDECVREALSQTTLLLENKKQHLVYAVPPTLAVFIDKNLIERVIVNLLTNASKYTPHNGTITLQAEKTRQNDSDWVKFSVTDTGQGVPSDKIHLIFEMFGQLEARSSGIARSSGLGLTFCKMAIEGHGGNIDVVSEFGKGCTFFFTVPASTKLQLSIENAPEATLSEINYGEAVSISFTDDERAYLRAYIEKMKAFDVYEITDIESILDTISPTSEAVQKWKEEIENAVHFCNAEEYVQALSI